MMIPIQRMRRSESCAVVLLLSWLVVFPNMSGCGGAPAVAPTRDSLEPSHAEAAAEIARLGGKLGPQVTAWKGQYVDIALGQDWSGCNEDLVLLSRLKRVDELSLQGEAFDESSLPFLQQARGLQVLHLSHTKLTGQAIGRLVQDNVDSLRVLDMNGPECDDACLAHLTSTKLRWLSIGPECQISDNALRDVGKLDGLLFLRISVAAVAGEQLGALRGLANLRGLILAGTSVSDAAMPHLKHLTALEYLDLSSTHVLGDDLWHLTSLEHLNTLLLNKTSITRTGLRHLATLPTLEAVSLDGTLLGDEDVELLSNLSHATTISMDDTSVTADGIGVLRRINSLLTATDGDGNTYVFRKNWASLRAGELYAQKQGQLFLWTNSAPQPITEELIREFWNERVAGQRDPVRSK